jgi:hypothetical protein
VGWYLNLGGLRKAKEKRTFQMGEIMGKGTGLASISGSFWAPGLFLLKAQLFP